MDDFKKLQEKNVGVGGIHCPCCQGKSRTKGMKLKAFNKMVRKQLKNQITKEIKNEISDYR